MARDAVSALLERAAPVPYEVPELEALWRRGGRRRRFRRAGLASTALVVAVAGIAVVIARQSDEREADVAAALGVPRGWRWESVADGPLDARSQHSAVWTGQEIVIWGGADGEKTFDDGAAYDPRHGQWRTISPSPLAGRTGHVAAWTGNEMIVWGGARTDRTSAPVPGADKLGIDAGTDPPTPLFGTAFADGAVYDPEADEWRVIGPAPLALRPYVAAWTGGEFVIVGERLRFEGASGSPAANTGVMEGLAYDPSQGSWRVIAPPPFPSQLAIGGAWTGEELVVWGGTDHGGAEGPTGGFAYDSNTDEWDTLPPAPLSDRQWHSVVWTGTRVVVWGGTDLVGPDKADGAAYDPSRRDWEAIAEAPVTGRQQHLAAAFHGVMIVWGGTSGPLPEGDGAAYNPWSDAWMPLPAAPIRSRTRSSITNLGDSIFLWGGEQYDGEATHFFADGVLLWPVGIG